MNPPSILITQCLQNDFAALIDRYDPLPNSLHIGYEEARRLVGERAEEGHVSMAMNWAYSTSPEKLKIIHIRDWHNPNDVKQKDHLKQFGNHCIKDTKGADFIFASSIRSERETSIVNASGLNDFVDTDLERLLLPFKGMYIRVGIIGVWTEAKVTFLAYDLKTRFPEFDLSVCSALTASSSRTMHFIALEQLKGVLGVNVFLSIGDFTNYLTGTIPEIAHIQSPRISADRLRFDPPYTVSQIDQKILSYLFRDAKDVTFSCLDGGFSGNVVLKAKAMDLMGHYQVPSVIKIGKRDMIAKERMSFERIQEVMGNNAPNIVDFVEIEDRGAIKYRYAAMIDNNIKTFQKFYGSTDDLDKIKKILEIIFCKQLERLYNAATLEKLNLLSYYDYNSKYAASIRKRVEEFTGSKADGRFLSLYGVQFPNVCRFYEDDLKYLTENDSASHYCSFIHGDLNGANIIVDAQENVWIIDYFHTHKGHILKDLIKLENDIIFIYTKIDSEEEFKEGVRFINILLNVQDLGVGLDTSFQNSFKYSQFNKCYEILSTMRSFYPELIHSDRDPYQYLIPFMRYAMHTTSFEECNDYQKKLALYAGAICSSKIKDILTRSSALRIDYVNITHENYKGKFGLTILPGRKDRNRDIDADIQLIVNSGIKYIVCLITEDEMEFYGVKNLKEKYLEYRLNVYYSPILDQGVPTTVAARSTIEWMNQILKNNENILIHCVGGLGRSGLIAACYLVEYLSFDSATAIKTIREYRSQRAIETKQQEEFVHNSVCHP